MLSRGRGGAVGGGACLGKCAMIRAGWEELAAERRAPLRGAGHGALEGREGSWADGDELGGTPQRGRERREGHGHE